MQKIFSFSKIFQQKRKRCRNSAPFCAILRKNDREGTRWTKKNGKSLQMESLLWNASPKKTPIYFTLCFCRRFKSSVLQNKIKRAERNANKRLTGIIERHGDRAKKLCGPAFIMWSGGGGWLLFVSVIGAGGFITCLIDEFSDRSCAAVIFDEVAAQTVEVVVEWAFK